MANEQLKRLFRRGPEIDEAEFELLQSRVQARLRAVGAEAERASANVASSDQDGSVATAVADEPSPDGQVHDRAQAEAAIDAPAGRAPHLPIRATTYELPENAVGVMADTIASSWEQQFAPLTVETSPTVETAVAEDAPLEVIADEAVPPMGEAVLVRYEQPRKPATAKAPRPKAPRPRSPSAKATRTKPLRAKTRSATVPAAISVQPPIEMAPDDAATADDVLVTMSTAPDPVPTPISVPQEATAPTLRPAAETRRPSAYPLSPRTLSPRPPVVRSAGLPYCPYCATLLDPPPEINRRCPRCRERIIVKRLDGRAVYLTEASVAVFEAERRRLMNAGRWHRERERWLKAATAVDAPADRMRRLEAAPISAAVVEASRALYITTVERAFRLAKLERRWEDASRTMREHALVLFRIAGSPVPPPEEILRPHRDGAAAALRGLGGMVREAELLGGKCCDACRADDRRTFPITAELRTPRLPHAGCPKGLCRCDWYLAARDESLVRRHLRRRKRTDTGQRQGV